MAAQGFKLLVCMLVAVMVVFEMVTFTEATYRKPPFNGSIFGKRGNSIEYEGAGKALSAMCEIASEACQAWFPAPENK